MQIKRIISASEGTGGAYPYIFFSNGWIVGTSGQTIIREPATYYQELEGIAIKLSKKQWKSLENFGKEIIFKSKKLFIGRLSLEFEQTDRIPNWAEVWRKAEMAGTGEKKPTYWQQKEGDTIQYNANNTAFINTNILTLVKK